ncbi:MAG: ATP-binding protein [Nitrospirota bacterium]|nr:ATP-binding protein [Nitrospirota bacterium]MDP2383966.1 ATP-binding protein [Nitrospirota bacterium]MDP3599103.1 ATP-binding protein [Nitrospirota bacterium]
MKSRLGFQLIHGYRQSPDKPMQPRTTLAQGIPYSTRESIPRLLHEQIEDSLTAALTASEQRLSALLHDRSRIGRELHESVLQALYAIELGLVHSRDQAVDQLQRLIQDIRRMILAVESDHIEPFNLVSELQFLAQTLEQMGQVRIDMEIDSTAEEILTNEEGHEFVTIAREALNNCVQHAQATEVEIALRHIGSRVSLSIRDNGSGFDITEEQTAGVGFAHMRERARRIGGHLNIESTIGQGTCITAEGPQLDIDLAELNNDETTSSGIHSRLVEP